MIRYWVLSDCIFIGEIWKIIEDSRDYLKNTQILELSKLLGSISNFQKRHKKLVFFNKRVTLPTDHQWLEITNEWPPSKLG